MEGYKQATKQKLRFETSKGSLATEQLWDLSLSELDKLAVSLERKKNANAKTFLTVDTQEDKTAQLKFDIALDILKSKVEEENEARKVIENKEHNQKVLAAIARKREGALEEMSIEELEKQLV